MAAPKCRVDVWQPTISNVTTAGVATTAQRPAAWVKCDTVTDVTTENPPGPNPNLRRANAVTSVEIKDDMFSPRVAYISIANKPQDFKAFDSDTMETQHQDSDGNEIQIGGSDVKTRIRRNWGPFSHFFKEFQQIRIVDLETHMVLFTGRIYNIKHQHDGQRGATVDLVCKDALEELKHIAMGTLPKELHFPANTYRSTIIQAMLNLGMNYENSVPTGGINKNQTSPVTTPLSGATSALNSNDANTSTTDGASGDVANSYSRFERSMTKPSTVTKLKTRKSGSSHILQELSRWAILEPHEDETAENAFGYDFFVDSNIGSNNLLATTAPPPSMFNYFKRGNRLSAAGSAGQDASSYGLTCMLPTEPTDTRRGIRQIDVGETAESGNDTVEAFAINANHSLYPGQVISIGSEQMYVHFVTNSDSEGGNREAHVIRGWKGSTPAAFSANTDIKENRPAVALIEALSASFNDTKDDLFTECDLTYETSYITGGNKLGTTEKNKKFEIMFVYDITKNGNNTFAWSGLDFDDEGKGSADDDPGQDSAEILTAYRAGDYGAGAGNTVYASNIGRIQYQSTAEISGATNFGYIMLSDVSGLPATNYNNSGTLEDYVVLKGNVSGATCKLNLGSLDVQTGRPSTAFAEGTERFRRAFTMTMETHDNIDDIRQEVAARLGQSAIAMKRGDFNVSKAPYYWADFKVHSVSNDGSTGQNLTVKSDNGTTAINVTNYGFREGMLVHKRTADYSQIATVAVSGVNKDVYGYCYDMTSDSAFKVNLTESQTFAVDDKIRLYIPVRAGDVMFVDHILATTYGEHLVTSVNFNESPRPMTTYSTVGENEPRIRMRVGSVNKQNVWNTIAVDKLEVRERERPNLPKGTQTFTFTGTFSFPAGNRVAWTAGDLRTSDGEVYQIVASNTNGGTGTSGSDTDYGLGSNGMTGSNKYVLYLDPEGENPSGNEYHFYTILESSYVEDEDNLVVLLMTPTSGAAPDCSKGPNFQSEVVFPHTELDASSKANPVNVGPNPPSNPAVGDIHIDTDTTNSWQRWDGSSWVTYDLGTAKAIGEAAQSSANAADTKADRKRQVFNQTLTPTTNLQQGDLWVNNRKAIQIYDTSAGWTLRDDAGAVSDGITNIDGARIATQTIILKSGGAGNSNNPNGILGNADDDNAADTGTRVVLSNTGIYGWSGSTTQFKMDASDGMAHFGGSSGIINSEGIYIQGGSDNDAGRLFLRGATASTTNLATSGDGNDGRYVLTNYLGTLYMFATGMSANNKAISPTQNAGVKLGTSTFGWSYLYLGDVANPSNAAKRLYHDGTENLKWDGNNLVLGDSSPQTLSSGDVLLLTGTLLGGSTTNADSLHTHSSSGGVSESSSPTWTGNHNFNGNVYMNGGTIEIGNSSSDTVTIDAKIAVGGYAVPGVRWVESNGTAGLWYDDSGGTYSRLYFVLRGMNSTSYMPYFSSNGTYSWMYSTYVQGSYLRAYDGSASYPSHSFTNDLDTGMYLDSALVFAYAGSARLYIGSSAIRANWSILPQVNQGYNLGSSSYRWHTIFSLNDLNTPSDAELKENKTTITNGLEFISSLNPISFNRIGSSDIQFGFTAQEVKQAVLNTGYTENAAVYSEDINEDTGETEWGMTYAALIAPLVASIKELKERIEVLEGN